MENNYGCRERANQNEGVEYSGASDVIDTAAHFDIPIELNTAGGCASNRSMPRTYPRDRQRELKIQIKQNTENCLQTSEQCIELFHSVADASVQKAQAVTDAAVPKPQAKLLSQKAAAPDSAAPS